MKIRLRHNRNKQPKYKNIFSQFSVIISPQGHKNVVVLEPIRNFMNYEMYEFLET